ncbi:orotidine-5'-phosphate decarboxylase [Gammaproteobacteria bacterium]|nr:orotidine-5'-phosphate decarboxylase [Gammaproteobacteria bacterium]
MKISIHQPQYIPWMPYFAKIKEADLFVLLDHVEFQKNGLQNRNQIKSSSGASWLTVPVVQSLGQKINEVETVGHMNWQAKHWNTIRMNYSKSKYFKIYADEIEEVYQLKWNNLCELNCHLLEKLCKWLEIDTPMCLSSDYNLSSSGSEAILHASNKGFDIFLDLKLHDIPNTVKKSIEGLKTLPISMLTIHTSGGFQMMKAAMEAVNGTDIKVFGVTALTSLTNEDTNIIYQRDAASQVNAMLEIATQAGIDGVVCSPHELNLVKQKESLLSITPGIRLSDLNDDQSRVMTPQKAIELGANYLVIGRPITEAEDPQNALKNIFNSIN